MADNLSVDMKAKVIESQDPNHPFPEYGIDGVITLLLSCFVIVVACGLSYLYLFIRVCRTAKRRFSSPSSSIVLVPGVSLTGGSNISEDFRLRLLKAKQLYQEGSVEKIMILGGARRQGEISEAEAGCNFLLPHGIPEDVLMKEGFSRHTLENLRYANAAFKRTGKSRFSIVTNRYHMERVHALASGLKIEHDIHAAEAEMNFDLPTLTKLLRDAFFLHWYYTGKIWSRMTFNSRSLEKICDRGEAESKRQNTQ